MMTLYTSGSFVLCVKVSGAVKYYAVKNFYLRKAKGAITQCRVSLMDVTWQVEVRNLSTYPKLSALAQLYNSACQPETKPMQCQLLQYNSRQNSGQPVQWFTGRVCVVTPVLAQRPGITSQYTCFCMGKACQLMFSYVSDYKYVDAKSANNVPQLQKNGLIGANAQATNIFSTEKLDTALLISNSGQSIQADTVDQLFTKAFNYLQQMRAKLALFAQTPTIDLSEYITSQYKISSVIKQAIKAPVDLGHSNPYLIAFDQMFASGIDNRQLIDAIMTTLAGQRFLTTAPAQRTLPDAQDKLFIIPNYVLPVQTQDAIITPEDINLVQVTANPLSHLSIPDKLFVNLTMLSAFDMGTRLMQNIPGLYGEYEAVTPASKIKQAGAPWWLLTIAVQKSRFKTYKADMKNIPVGQSAVTQTQQNASWADGAKQMFDTYTKTLYFSMYAAQKQATVSLLPTDKAKNMDRYIGKSIALQLPLDQQNLNDRKYSKFFGVLDSVTYQYGCSTSPQQSSYLTITANVTALTPQSSDFAKAIFQDQQTPLLYQKSLATSDMYDYNNGSDYSGLA